MREWFRRKLLRYPVRVFLAIALFFGLLFAFLTPPMQAPDEHHHFFRSYQVSTGKLVPDRIRKGVGGNLPEAIKITGYNFLGDLPGNPSKKANSKQIKSELGATYDPSELAQTHFEPGASSSPVPYLPQAMGMRLSRVFGASPLAQMYAGRLANFAVWLSLTALALRLLPFGRWLTVAVFASPVFLFQAASLSADALTNGLALLIAAACLWIIASKRQVSWRIWGLTLLAAAGISFCKQAYFTIPWVLLAIPGQLFGSKKRRALFFISLAITTIGPALVWGLVSRDFLPELTRNFSSADVDPTRQIRWIIGHPLSYVLAVARTFLTDFGSFLLLQFNGKLGWADVSIPLWAIYLHILTLFSLWLAANTQPVKLVKWQRVIAASVSLTAAAALVVVLTLSWTGVGSNVVHGLQGRYFFPILPITLFFLGFKAKLRMTVEAQARLVSIVLPVILTASIVGLVGRYYG